MSLPVKTGLPDSIDLAAGYVVRFLALDPTTGAAVAGVKIVNALLEADASGTGSLDSGAFQMVPGPGA